MDNGLAHELSVREIQLVSLEILKRIDAICKEQGLTYYLTYGTLIGAIRHNGFIPWDDDVDIAMPRKDYDALQCYFESHGAELQPLIALHNTKSRKLPFLITRITDTRYKQIGECSEDVPEMGAFVDVYPLDGLGSTEEEAIAEKKRCHSLSVAYLRSCNFSCHNKGNGLFKRIAKTARAALMRSPEYYENQLLLSCSNDIYESSSYIACKVWTVSRLSSVINPSCEFASVEYVPFEDMLAPVPAGFDSLLRRIYGDYMQLPPENERVGHHGYSIVKRGESD